MPIGFARGDFGSSRPAPSPPPAPTTPIATRPEPPPIRHFAEPRITWERFITAEDERVCPVCAPLDGSLWRAGEGPEPPLHDRCRCFRGFAYEEVGTG